LPLKRVLSCGAIQVLHKPLIIQRLDERNWHNPDRPFSELLQLRVGGKPILALYTLDCLLLSTRSERAGAFNEMLAGGTPK
jgi:hypothetical protein